MKNLIKFLVMAGFTVIMVSCCTSCTSTTTSDAATELSSGGMLSSMQINSFTDMDENSYGREQLFTEASQSNFNKVQPPQSLSWSLERDNLNKRNERCNDPNKISYIYLISDMGTIIGYFPMLGKVSSVNSKLTTNQQMIENPRNSSACQTVESPSMDGSYGSNGDAVFFFLTDGTYMEWAGKYLLCDNYVALTQTPLLTYDVSEVVK